jgi:hypothetical protein
MERAMNTMDAKINAKDLLLVFEHIKDRGEQRGEYYVYNRLRATVGHDGYTLTVENEQVSATVHFHNVVHVDSPNRTALNQFLEQVDAILAAQRNR